MTVAFLMAGLPGGYGSKLIRSLARISAAKAAFFCGAYGTAEGVRLISARDDYWIVETWELPWVLTRVTVTLWMEVASVLRLKVWV